MKGKKKQNTGSVGNLQNKTPAISAQAHAHLVQFAQKQKADADPIPTSLYLLKTPPKMHSQVLYATEKAPSRISVPNAQLPPSWLHPSKNKRVVVPPLCQPGEEKDAQVHNFTNIAMA